MTSESAALSLRQHVAIFVASLGGVGRFPIAPATLGSALGVGLYLLLPADAAVQLASIACVAALGVWSAGICASAAHDEDPAYVVIDEVAGVWIACFLLPASLPKLAAAFVVFRVFDIGKWFPMRQLERLPGGWGIVADDLAAGLLTRLLLLLWT